MYIKYVSNWAVLVDKVYTGLADQLRVIVLSKKTKIRWLWVAERTRHRHISSDDVLIENYFGRFCSIIFFGSKWKWSEIICDEFMKLGAALTIAHVILHPLRHDDGTHYRTQSNRLKTIGSEHTSRRTLSQTAYRNRRRRHLPKCFRKNILMTKTILTVQKLYYFTVICYNKFSRTVWGNFSSCSHQVNERSNLKYAFPTYICIARHISNY